MRRLPNGAQQIWDLRMKRMKPSEIVFISVIGRIPANWQINIDLTDKFQDLEWRWVADLPTCLVFDETSNRKRLLELATVIARCAPNGGYVKPFNPNFGYLWLWNAALGDAHLMQWWKGHEGLPELGIEDQPEQIEVFKASKFEQMLFEEMGI